MVDLETTDKLIVLIDGECNFCNKSALFIIKYDKNDRFRFVSQQSELGKNILQKNNYQGSLLSTIILLKDKELLTKTTALIEIARHLNGLPKVFSLLRFVPLRLRDYGYDIFSKYRYKLFGREKECSIPSIEIRNKFLS